MPGDLKRQNAFSEFSQSKPFTELQCHICEEYEYDGDWIKIQCDCGTTLAYHVYTHKHCLEMSSKCKKCGQAYSTPIMTTTTTHTSYYATLLLELMRKYRVYLLLSICCIILGWSLINDTLSCITLDLVDGQELEGLTDADYLYLPVSYLSKC